MESVLLRATDGASVRIYAHGAHISSWIPAGGAEQLFLSKASAFREGAAIRGGVPVIFPQFAGLGSLPKHGFARTTNWRFLRSEQTMNGAAQAAFELQESAASLQLWPHAFKAGLLATVSGNTLQIDLTVVNNGDAEFNFTCALHTYFNIEKIAETRLRGLAGLRYRDMVSGINDNLERNERLEISGEIDRIYADLPGAIEIHQTRQTTFITQSGFADTVIWNPGAEKGAALPDLETDGHTRMLCVEAAAILRPVRLAAGSSWTGSQNLRAERADPNGG